MNRTLCRILFFVANFAIFAPLIALEYTSTNLLKACKDLNTPGECLVEGIGGNERIGKYYYRINDPRHRLLQVTKKADGKCYMEMQLAPGKVLKTVDINYAGRHVITRRALMRPIGAQGETVVCDVSNGRGEVNGSYSSLNDAHFYAKVVYDMYTDPKYFGHNPWPNLDVLWMNVHYITMNDPHWSPNGRWDGAFFGAWFNDGDEEEFYPAGSSLQLVAHELAHGFSKRIGQCSGDGDCREAQGLREFYSDFAGQAAQHYLYPDRDPDITSMIAWEDVYKKHYTIPAEQDMCADEQNIQHFKAFCLIARANKNGIPLAFKVYSLANQNYWHETTNFKAAARDVCRAAKDLARSHPRLQQDVIEAFKKTGIELMPNCQIS